MRMADRSPHIRFVLSFCTTVLHIHPCHIRVFVARVGCRKECGARSELVAFRGALRVPRMR